MKWKKINKSMLIFFLQIYLEHPDSKLIRYQRA
jgi:hypothetical protein